MRNQEIVLLTVALSSGAMAQGVGPIHERPLTSWSTNYPTIKLNEPCAGGGQTAYLEHGGASKPTKIGICVWSRSTSPSGSIYSESINYYSGALSGHALRQPLGCHVPGSVEYHIAYYDLDDGYNPGQAVLTESDASLVLQTTTAGGSKHYVVRNSNFTKNITISYRLGNSHTIASIPRQGDQLVSEVISSHFDQPYRSPEMGAPCD